ncbi:MAG TPA: hypothetical protein DDX98_03820 [Bacteroidales bacterium]|jgi:hypothetical protein|nr:hypothetical protein [Bacteroidales bacterium]
MNIVVCYNDKKKFQEFSKLLIDEDCSIHSIENIENIHSIPSAYNLLFKKIKSEYIIYLHQDVIIPSNWKIKICDQIKEIEKIDKKWGVIGIMGVKNNGFFAGHIIDPHTRSRFCSLPCEVETLDEVCLVLRRDANLKFDEYLGGFHFYGADICLQARQKRLKCYAIDAPIQHLSGGKADQSFWEMAKKMKSKWSQIDGSINTIETTCGVFKLNDKIWTNIEYLYKNVRRKFIRRLQKRHINQSHENK